MMIIAIKINAVTSFRIVEALNQLTFLQILDQKSQDFCAVFVVFFMLHFTLLNCKLPDSTVFVIPSSSIDLFANRLTLINLLFSPKCDVIIEIFIEYRSLLNCRATFMRLSY